MEKITLPFDQKNEMFMGEFKDVSRDFIQFLKDNGLLEKVTPEFIEMMPETFDGKLNIDPAANTEDAYWVFFYLNVKATEEMKISTQEYLSRDIDINEDDETLEFNFFVPKTSKFVIKADDQEMILSF